VHRTGTARQETPMRNALFTLLLSACGLLQLAIFATAFGL
jgi:hypothetical protein